MHFVARCDRYPSFAFVVPALREARKKAGAKKVSGVVKFQNRILDTKADGYTEKEAAFIEQVLKKVGGGIEVKLNLPLDEGVQGGYRAEELSITPRNDVTIREA